VQLEEDCIKVFQTRSAAFIAQKRAQNGTRSRKEAGVTEEELTINANELTIDAKGGGASPKSPRSPFGSWGRKSPSVKDMGEANQEGEVEIEMVNPLHEPAGPSSPGLDTIHSQLELKSEGISNDSPDHNTKADI
jgi:hypothetical protein